MITASRTAYKAMNANQRARHDFLYELERHYGVTVELVASHIAKAYVDAPVATAIALYFSADSNRVTVKEIVGRSAAVELATIADFRRFTHAACTLIASAVER